MICPNSFACSFAKCHPDSPFESSSMDVACPEVLIPNTIFFFFFISIITLQTESGFFKKSSLVKTEWCNARHKLLSICRFVIITSFLTKLIVWLKGILVGWIRILSTWVLSIFLIWSTLCLLSDKGPMIDMNIRNIPIAKEIMLWSFFLLENAKIPTPTSKKMIPIISGWIVFCVKGNIRLRFAQRWGLAKYGNRCLSSPEQMLIEKLLLKITTKS